MKSHPHKGGLKILSGIQGPKYYYRQPSLKEFLEAVLQKKRKINEGRGNKQWRKERGMNLVRLMFAQISTNL